MNLDTQIVTTTIVVVGGLITTFLTIKWKNDKNRKDAEKSDEPKRMTTIFDGYESLIAELKADNDRKSIIIEKLQKIVDTQQEEINKSQGLINTLRIEVDSSKAHANKLEAQLQDMKKTYNNGASDTM